jgi:hypothetical protein
MDIAAFPKNEIEMTYEKEGGEDIKVYDGDEDQLKRTSTKDLTTEFLM